MAHEFLCASGFGSPDGTYVKIYQKDAWEHSSSNYWILLDGDYYILANSLTGYQYEHWLAIKIYPDHDDPTGNYSGYDGKPDGTVSDGVC